MSIIGAEQIITSLAGLAARCLERAGEIARLRRDRRVRIADYLQDVGKTIGAVATGIDRGRNVDGKCGELLGHLQVLAKTTKPALGRKHSRELQSQIELAYRVEALAMEVESAAKREKGGYVAQLRAISGTFLAISKSIRAL